MKTIDKFLEIYFEEDKASQIVKEELLNLRDFQKEIIEKIKSKLSQPHNRAKAEDLLREILSIWLR
jgi:hypothetical protein